MVLMKTSMKADCRGGGNWAEQGVGSERGCHACGAGPGGQAGQQNSSQHPAGSLAHVDSHGGGQVADHGSQRQAQSEAAAQKGRVQLCSVDWLCIDAMQGGKRWSVTEACWRGSDSRPPRCLPPSLAAPPKCT